MNKRIFYSDNGNLTDLSSTLNRYSTNSYTFDYIAGQDYIYIGGRLPFSSLFFKLGTQNSAPSTMIVECFDGNAWSVVDDLIDQTMGFTGSNHIQIIPDDESGWHISNTNDGSSIPGLTSLNIKNLYWMRISFSDDLDSGTSLNWIGSLFSDDDDLGVEYPDLVKPSVLASFVTGKTDWEEQHVRAADIIIQDLQINRSIVDSGQLLEREDYRAASVQKTAEIIFAAFGDDFADQRKTAREEYQRRISNPAKKIDVNANATEDQSETHTQQGWLSR